MAYSYATYSVHCDTLITLSTLLINYASVMTPWIMLAVHQYCRANVCKRSSLEHSHTLCIATIYLI